jgi:hypothetical protein
LLTLNFRQPSYEFMWRPRFSAGLTNPNGPVNKSWLWSNDGQPGPSPRKHPRQTLMTPFGQPYVNTKNWYKRGTDLWARFGDKSRSTGEDFLHKIRQRCMRSAVCFRSAKGLFALISRDRVVTWLERKGRMDG